MRNLIVLSSFLTAASLQASTVAWWRFEAGPANTDVQKLGAAPGFNFDHSVPDSSGSGNDLSVWETGGGAGFVYRTIATNTANATILQTGAANNFSVENANTGPAMFTDPGGPLTNWQPAAFTFEVSVKPENNNNRTWIGRDSQGGATDGSDPALSAMYFQARGDNSVAFEYLDVSGNMHTAVSAPNVIRGWNFDNGNGTPDVVPWQNVAAVSDGHTLTIWLDNGLGYYSKVASTDLGTVTAGDTALSKGTGTATGNDWIAGGFSVGRGLFNGGHTDRAYGLIDEVRFSDTALTPSQFLFATPTQTHAILAPLSVTGWNQDMVLNNGSASYDKSITGTIDDGGGAITGATLMASGTYPLTTDGFPEGTLTDIVALTNDVYTAPSLDTFKFQDFSSPNSILMTPGQSGTLTLTTPASMTTLGLFGTSGTGGLGPNSGTVTLHFADASSTDYPITTGEGITADWFNGGLNIPALQVGNRGTVNADDSYATIKVDYNAVISIYETRITLSSADQAKKVSSVEVKNTGTNGTIAVMAIDADTVSSTPTPLKITSSSFDFTGSTVTLNFTSTSGTKYRATHSATLNGTDWTAVGSTLTATGTTSSLTVPFVKGAKDFFRIEVAP
jgi:hypothetical protein